MTTIAAITTHPVSFPLDAPMADSLDCRYAVGTSRTSTAAT